MQRIFAMRLWVILGMTFLAGCGKQQSVSVEQMKVTPVKSREVLGLIREPGAKVVLVNMWATWCEPCRKEFPVLVRLARSYQGRGLRVVFVSMDDEGGLPNVKKFLAQNGVNFPSYIKAEKDMEFINGLDPRWSGALPATFIYDENGKVKHFWEGEADYTAFEQKVLAVLNK